MTPRAAGRRDHTRPDRRDDGGSNYQLGPRERMTIRPLTAGEIRRARLTLADRGALDCADALGIGRVLDVITEGTERTHTS